MNVAFASLALLGLAVALFGHGSSAPHHPAVGIEMSADSVSVPLTLVDGHVVVDVTVNAKGPFPFLFDTGAQGNVLDLAFAREMGLPSGTEIKVSSPGGRGRPGYQVTMDRLEIGGLSLTGVSSVAFDGLPFARTDTSPRGVISPYGWNGLLVTLDYPRQRVVFRRGALPEPDGREIFGWSPGQRLPELPVTVAGRHMKLHLDSGAPGGLGLPTALAEELPLDGPLVDLGYAKTVDQIRPVRGAPLRGSFVVGRYSLDRPTLRFVDLDRKVANMGAAILGQFALTIDPAHARLRLAGPADGRLHETASEKRHYGIQLAALEADPMRVLIVDAGSPAERGGLRAGDDVLQMNGRPLGRLSVDERLAALRDSTLELAVRRGQDMLSLTLETRRPKH